MLVNHFLSLPYSTPCFYFNQGQTYTRAEGGHAPPPPQIKKKKKKKKTIIQKIKICPIYIYIYIYLSLLLYNI